MGGVHLATITGTPPNTHTHTHTHSIAARTLHPTLRRANYRAPTRQSTRIAFPSPSRRFISVTGPPTTTFPSVPAPRTTPPLPPQPRPRGRRTTNVCSVFLTSCYAARPGYRPASEPHSCLQSFPPGSPDVGNPRERQPLRLVPAKLPAAKVLPGVSAPRRRRPALRLCLLPLRGLLASGSLARGGAGLEWGFSPQSSRVGCR